MTTHVDNLVTLKCEVRLPWWWREMVWIGCVIDLDPLMVFKMIISRVEWRVSGGEWKPLFSVSEVEGARVVSA